MANLTAKQFDNLVREYFGKVLEPYGFSCEASKYCTFYKIVSDEIYHFILPDKSRSNPKYDIKVFPHSPKLDSEFNKKFPDNLGITTDIFSSLHSKRGVGPYQEWYWCRTKEGFIRNFEEKVSPALINFAIPFLESISTIEDMQNIIKVGPFVSRIKECVNGA